MAKILICPDVHGRKFWHKAEEMIDSVDKVIFLGDYLDPYPDEGITFDQALSEFNQILKFKESHSDKVILLLGNHDMHYVNTEFMDCSRLNRAKRFELNQLYKQNFDKFSLIYLLENRWLFSHAGVYQAWLSKYEMTLDDLLNCENFLQNHWVALEDLSYYRGGYNYVGSCVWADIRESLRNPLLADFQHIVGHTQLNETLYISSNVTCVDVRRCFLLDTETGNITNA